MRQKILIVEDELSTRMLLENSLGDNFEVITKENGFEAMNWIQYGNHPDLLLIDINMPMLNGYELIESIRKFKGMASVPVLILSDKQKNGNGIKSFAADANDYIQKPFSPAALINQIETVFRKAKAA